MKTLRDGALRFWSDTEKDWVVASPGDYLYSTVTMAATEYLKDGVWVRIYEDDDEHETNT